MRCFRLIALILLLAQAACDGGDGSLATISLSWRFADDRTCDLAGVVNIVVTIDGDETTTRLPLTYRCAEALAPDGQIQLEILSLPATITLEGQTISGAVLYRGQLDLSDETPGAAVVTLRFTGGDEP